MIPTPTVQEYKAIQALANVNPERAATALVISTEVAYMVKKKKSNKEVAKVKEWTKTNRRSPHCQSHSSPRYKEVL
jgi:hypothetical protein